MSRSERKYTVYAKREFTHGGQTVAVGEPVTATILEALSLQRRGDVSFSIPSRPKKAMVAEGTPRTRGERMSGTYRTRDMSAQEDRLHAPARAERPTPRQAAQEGPGANPQPIPRGPADVVEDDAPSVPVEAPAPSNPEPQKTETEGEETRARRRTARRRSNDSEA